MTTDPGESGVLRDPEPPTPTCICDHPKDEHSYAWDDEPGDPMACDVLDCTCGEYTEQAEGGQLDPDDELLARYDACFIEGAVTSTEEWMELACGLASALRRKGDEVARVNDEVHAFCVPAAIYERELAEARSGLQHVNRHGCENNTRGSCLTDPSRSRDAEYGADQWCDPCIAADALGKKENSR